ncbi:hypothetical protein [Bacillus taeanensis]|nr:hypothetical protein [Bacillus taeanensis]
MAKNRQGDSMEQQRKGKQQPKAEQGAPGLQDKKLGGPDRPAT